MWAAWVQLDMATQATKLLTHLHTAEAVSGGGWRQCPRGTHIPAAHSVDHAVPSTLPPRLPTAAAAAVTAGLHVSSTLPPWLPTAAAAAVPAVTAVLQNAETMRGIFSSLTALQVRQRPCPAACPNRTTADSR